MSQTKSAHYLQAIAGVRMRTMSGPVRQPGQSPMRASCRPKANRTPSALELVFARQSVGMAADCTHFIVPPCTQLLAPLSTTMGHCVRPEPLLESASSPTCAEVTWLVELPPDEDPATSETPPLFLRTHGSATHLSRCTDKLNSKEHTQNTEVH